MRTTAATLLLGCLAAVPLSAKGQTTILPPTATLNDPAVQRQAPRGEGPFVEAPRGEAPRGEALAARREAGVGNPGHSGERVGERAGERAGERGRRGEGRAPRGRTCLAQAEARETVVARRLIDPVRALHFGRQQGDALNAKLCRWPPEEFVYEIDVLRHDGRLLRLFMNAQNGEPVIAPSQAVQAGGRPQEQSPQPGGRPPDRDR